MKLCDQKGLALVETALSIVLLFTLIFGITELGRALYIRNTLANAAREGARLASVSTSTTLNETDLRDKTLAYLPTDLRADVTVVFATTETPLIHAQSRIQVTVTKPLTFLVPVVSTSNVVLTTKAQMLYE